MKHSYSLDLATCAREFVHVKPLAKALGVDPRTVRRMIDSGALSAYRVGREWRIRTEDACRVFHVQRPVNTTRCA